MRWRLEIPKAIEIISVDGPVYVIEGTGLAPVPKVLDFTDPPVVDPPVVEDTSIFVFPPQPLLGADNPAQRNYTLWTTPEGDHFYATAPEFRNPLPGSHLCAGPLPARPRGYWGDFSVAAGDRLWVPGSAGQGYPAVIRRLLAGERPS